MNTDLSPAEFVAVELPQQSPSGCSTSDSVCAEQCTGILFADPLPALGDLLAIHFRKAFSPRKVCSADSISDVKRRLQQKSNLLIVSSPHLIDGSFYDLLRAVKAEFPEARFVLWGDRISRLIPLNDIETVIPRSISVDQLETRLRDLLSNSASPDERADALAENLRPDDSPHQSATSRLSKRQLEVLILITEGLTVREIAQRMNLSAKSVDSLKYRLMKRLNLHDRVGLVRLAIREGLIDP